MQFYQKVKKYLEYDTDLEEENKEKRNTIKLATHLNIAMCQIKLGDYTAAREECDNALELDVNNVKAYFRRATVRYFIMRHVLFCRKYILEKSS